MFFFYDSKHIINFEFYRHFEHKLNLYDPMVCEQIVNRAKFHKSVLQVLFKNSKTIEGFEDRSKLLSFRMY